MLPVFLLAQHDEGLLGAHPARLRAHQRGPCQSLGSLHVELHTGLSLCAAGFRLPVGALWAIGQRRAAGGSARAGDGVRGTAPAETGVAAVCKAKLSMGLAAASSAPGHACPADALSQRPRVPTPLGAPTLSPPGLAR